MNSLSYRLTFHQPNQVDIIVYVWTNNHTERKEYKLCTIKAYDEEPISLDFETLPSFTMKTIDPNTFYQEKDWNP